MASPNGVRFPAFLLSALILMVLMTGVASAAVGNLDVSVSVSAPTEPINGTEGEALTIPFKAVMTGVGNYVGDMPVEVTASSSQQVSITTQSLSLASGQSETVSGTVTVQVEHEDLDVTVTVKAKISEDGNFGQGVGKVRVDSARISVEVPHDHDHDHGDDDHIEDHSDGDGHAHGTDALFALDNIPYGTVAIYLCLFLLVGFVGGYLPFLKNWDQDQMFTFIAFGSGVVLSAALVHLLPEAFEMGGALALAGLAVGFGAFGLMEFVEHRTGAGHDHSHVCDVDDEDGTGPSLKVFAGFSFHNIMDGIMLAISILLLAQSDVMGIIILVAIAAHKAPTSFTFTCYYLAGGAGKRKTLRLLVAFQMFLAVGMVILLSLIGSVTDAALAFLLGVSGGLFLMIGGWEMLYRTVLPQRERLKAALPAFALGFVVMLLFSFVGH